MKKILIAAPLAYELEPLKQILSRENLQFQIETITLGVGPKNSVKTLGSFLDKDPRWDQVLVMGLAGALSGDLRGGDLVTPSWIFMDGKKLMIPEPDSRIVTGEAKPVAFLTASRILKPSEKAQALEDHPEAQAVDMESFGLAELLFERKISFKIFRSILDEKDYIFPDFRWIFSQGKREDALPFVGYALRHPRKGAAVIDFKWRIKRSLGRLTRFVALYLRSEFQQ